MGRDGSSASSASGLTEPSIWGPRLLLRCVLLAQTRDLPLVTQRHDLNPGLAPVASLPCAELCRGWTWRLVGRPRWTPSWRRGCGPEPAGVGTGDTPTRLCPPAREASVPGAGPWRPRSLSSAPGAPVGPGHMGTFLRVGQTGATSLESSKFVLKLLKQSDLFPVTALPEICPQGTKIRDIIRAVT